MPTDSGYTTITVPCEVKEELDDKRNGVPWGQFLDPRRPNHTDSITFNDVDELGDRLAEELGGGAIGANVDEALAEAGVSLTYDDVKAACGAALRDELADEVLGR